MEKLQELEKNKKLVTVLLMIVSVLLSITVLLPYASATKEYKERLLQYPDMNYVEEIGMTNKEAVHVSLLEYGRMYIEAFQQGINQEICIATTSVIVVFEVCALLALLFALLKKPIGVLIFDLLALVVHFLVHWDFELRGVIPSYSYHWGVAFVFGIVMGVLSIGIAIWLFIVKLKYKKSKKILQSIEMDKDEAN